MKVSKGLLGITFAVFLTACGVESVKPRSNLDEAWNRANAPGQMDYVYLTGERDYLATFAQLPLSGSLSTVPWSDNYYPTYKGGISYRWNKRVSNESDRYSYPIRFQETDLKYLSPSEKFDIFTGAKHMPLTNSERRRTNIMATVPGSKFYDPSFNIPTWEGLCDAWAPATLGYLEPQPVSVTNAWGIEVPFGSSDIKALLTLFLRTYDSDRETQFLGGRCDDDFAKLEAAVAKGEMTMEEFQRIKESSACRDTNAGAFHVVVANQLGRLDEGFIMDATRDAEVWNQPVYKFESKVVKDYLPPSQGSARGTVQEVQIETKLHYVVEVDESYYPNNQGSLTYRTYRYRLELDANGEIIGGAWLDSTHKDDRPDFLWKRPIPEFTGEFAALKDIYEAATR